MKKILSLLLAAALPLSAACTMVARAEENPAPQRLGSRIGRNDGVRQSCG